MPTAYYLNIAKTGAWSLK